MLIADEIDYTKTVACMSRVFLCIFPNMQGPVQVWASCAIAYGGRLLGAAYFTVNIVKY